MIQPLSKSADSAELFINKALCFFLLIILAAGFMCCIVQVQSLSLTHLAAESKQSKQHKQQYHPSLFVLYKRLKRHTSGNILPRLCCFHRTCCLLHHLRTHSYVTDWHSYFFIKQNRQFQPSRFVLFCTQTCTTI